MIFGGPLAKVPTSSANPSHPQGLQGQQWAHPDDQVHLRTFPAPPCGLYPLYHGQGAGSIFSAPIYSAASALPNNFEKLHLDGRNFNIWNKEVQVCLLKEGTLEMVLDPPTFPLRDPRRVAYTTLLSSLDAKLYPRIPDGLTAGEVWGLLYSLFNSDSLGSTTRLTSEFYNTKLRFAASMAEHLGKLKVLRAELVLRDYPVNEANMIAIILASLDRSWGNFIVSLEGTRKDAMTLSYLTGWLNEEDRRCRDAGEYTRATTHRTSRRHQDSEQSSEELPPSPARPKHGSNQRRCKGQRRGHGKGKGGANDNFVCNSYLTPATGLWLLDSGALSHIENLKQEVATPKGPQPTPRPLKGSKAEAVAPKLPQPAPQPSKANPSTDEIEEQDKEISLPGPEGEDELFSPKGEDTPSSPDSSPPMMPQRPVMPSTWDRGPPHPG
ncbi:hypothetical protein E2320_018418 [Naja naja]|nr:hypothetical protein E2320_018418 [Naja naja]